MTELSALVARAREREAAGELRAAASAWDRAFGLAPDDAEIRERRADVLDRLELREHGFRFRYIPAGPFFMGSDEGEPDERPRREVEVAGFWLADVPLSWALICALLDWEPPPSGLPKPREEDEDFTQYNETIARSLSADEGEDNLHAFAIMQNRKIRLQYCEDGTTRAYDWHAHVYGQRWSSGQTSQELFGAPPREDPRRPVRYDRKPAVAVSLLEVAEIGRRLSTDAVVYQLPSEAEWEKAARGGLVDAPYPWGHEAPDQSRCDFDQFDKFALKPSRRFAANGYGLHAMAGGVWEWTRSDYDALAGYGAPAPKGAPQERLRVLRGGSWADCGEALRVSFRNALPPATSSLANIGARMARYER